MTNPAKVTLPRVMRSELVKLYSVRSTRWTLGVTALLVVGLAALVCAVTNADWAHMSLGDKLTFQATQTSLLGINFALLSVGVLGVLAFTGEYHTGMVRSTFAAVPRRWPVLAAKVIVYLLVVVALAIPTVLGAFLLGQLLLHSHATSLGAPQVWRALSGTMLYLGVDCVLGMALGLLIRATAGAVAALVVLTWILPIVVALIPGSIASSIAPYLPAAAGDAVMNIGPTAGSLSPWAGFGVFCAWAAVLLVGATVTLLRRDA